MGIITLQTLEESCGGLDRIGAFPPAHAPILRGAQDQRIEDDQFLLMARAFCRTGGLATANEVVRLLRRYVDQPLSKLAHWIVSGVVVNLDWRCETFIPMFQFNRLDLSLRPEVLDVVRELAGAFDNWDTALWFAESNGWLQEAAPVDIITNDQLAVLRAARADRFIARC